MHVAEIDYIDFFESVFNSRNEAEAFISEVENIPTKECKVKVLVHQVARMLWLGDRIGEVSAGRPALQLLFHLITAELVAKIFKGNKKGQPRQHVRMFFEDICTDSHRDVLGQAFSRCPHDNEEWLSVRETIDLLYKIRCDVVHKGKYTLILIRRNSNIIGFSRHGDEVLGNITIDQIRTIVLEGSVQAARKMVDAYKQSIEESK